jgi:hypothetical protein
LDVEPVFRRMLEKRRTPSSKLSIGARRADTDGRNKPLVAGVRD